MNAGHPAAGCSGIPHLPITTIRVARKVGEFMRELYGNANPKTSYRFYV